MGKKYIIEIGRLERLYKAFINELGKPELTWLSPEVDLTPYTEPDLDHVRKEAYEKGYHEGHNVCYENAKDLMEEKKNEAYQRGLADAWEAAKKIASDDAGQNHVIFGQHFANVIFNTFTASEAIEKIRQYEQKKEEQIQVGDEVIATSGKAVIVSINDDKNKARYIYHDSTLGFDKVCNLSKTGRHFSEIAAVLEKMRGKQE